MEKDINVTNDTNMNMPIYPAVNIPKKKPKIKMSLFDIAVAVINFFLTYALIDNVVTGVFNESLGYKLSLIYAGMFALATVYITSKTKKFSKEAILPSVAAILYALCFALHSKEGLNAVLFFSLIYLSGSYCIKLTKSNVHRTGSWYYLLDVIKCEVLIPLKNIFKPFVSLSTIRIRKGEDDKKAKRRIIGIIIGVVCAVPVLLIVVPLLIDSDAAFESLIGALVDRISGWFSDNVEDKFGDMIFLFIPTLISSTYIFSVMFAFRNGLTNSENRDSSKKYEKLRAVSPNILAGFLGVICLVYVVYLVSQFGYFFSAFFGNLPGGMKITVTEYARRGFFELAKIAAVNFALIALTVVFSARKNGKLSPIVKGFDVFLCVFTLILTATSISKILLYITSMGLTENRLYVFAFDVVLCLSFIAILIRLFKNGFPYLKVIIVSACAAVLFFGVIGTGNIISRYNADLFESGKLGLENANDYYELDENAHETIKLLYSLAQNENKEISKNAKEVIRRNYYRYIKFAGVKYFEKSVEIYNLDDYLNFKFIKAHYDFFIGCYNDNDEYIDDKRAYVFKNTKEKVKDLTVTDNEGAIFVCDKDPDKTGNFEIMTFDGECDGVGYNYDLYTDKNYVICFKDAGGHEYIYNVSSNCVEILDGENGLTVKDADKEPLNKKQVDEFFELQKSAAVS